MAGPGATLGEHKRALSIWLVTAAVLAGLIACGEATGWQSPIDRDTLRAFLEQARATPFAFPIVVLTFIIAGGLFFPVTALNLMSAMVFGPVYGVLYALAGALSAAAVYFGAGHLLGAGFLRRAMGKRMQRIDSKIADSGIIGVVLVRFVPVAPYTAVNLAAGVSSLGFGTFMAGTLLALLPGAVARGLVGDSLTQIVLDPSPQTLAYLGGGLALWAAIVFGSFRLARRLRARRQA